MDKMIKIPNKMSVENAVYYRSTYRYSSISKIQDFKKMHGARRVATFCILTAVLPTLLIIIPLYLRHSLYADILYHVAESDVIEITEGISPIFCQEHVLNMNSSFSAYQISNFSEVGTNRKHIRLKKSMILPDDTLEYWGFYLLKGASVTLKVCSRFEGSRILVVRGERNLRTCGLLEHNLHKFGPNYDKEYNQVKVTFETAAQEIKTDTQDTERDVNTGEEDFDDKLGDDVDVLQQFAENYLKKRLNKSKNETLSSEQNVTEFHTKRHSHKKQLEEVKQLQEELYNDEKSSRKAREIGHKLDGGIEHGGNAINYTGGESSASSFETNLFKCYDGHILLTQGFPPSHKCNDIHYLSNGDHMHMTHEVSSDGYYYYIFYSDNDLVTNDIHAVFDIYKPTYQYSNISDAKQCTNKTQCSFAVSFFSGETVIVEIPTRDGIEHEEDDITLLVSICKPRMAVYIIFPITILFLILGCAFL